MNCPICNSETEKGRLFGDRYALKWLSERKKLFLGIWAFGAECVDSRKTETKLFSRPFVTGHKCAKCKKLILDLD